MKTLRYFALPLAALAFSSCASVGDHRVADYNGDGVVSDAELKQYNKQATVQERAVYTESVKRRNAVNTINDTRDSVWGVRSIVSGIRSF